MINSLIFGKNVRALREIKKYTESELSIQVDIDPPQLSKVELGKQLPTAKVAVNIANYFGLSLCDLFVDKSEERNKTILQIKSLLSSIDSESECDHLYKTLIVLHNSVEG